MSKKRHKVRGRLWVYPGDVAWHFMTVPKKEAEAIKEAHGANSRGFGSLPVEAKIGKTVWKTSIFPDRKAGTYLLPVKKAVRNAEGIYEGDAVSLALTIKS